MDVFSFLALMIIGIVAIVWLLVRTLSAQPSNPRGRANDNGDSGIHYFPTGGSSSNHPSDTGATNYDDSSSSWSDGSSSSSDGSGGGGDGGGGGD